MKKWIEKIFFSTFLFVVTILSTLTVSALTITETVNPKDNFDNIVDGTIIMGITKFEPNVVVTALRASDATFNDVVFNYGNVDYKGVNIYYLLSGSWFQIDEENNAHPISDATLIENLNELDIYYVNNKEKMIEISYHKQLEEGYELVFKTNNDEKNDDVTYGNGKISVPATVKKLELFVKNTKTLTQQKLDVFEKEKLNDILFNRISADGIIEKGDSTGGDLDYTVTNNKITIDGNINWYKSDANAQNGRPAGNYASVKISAPEIYTEEELLANTTIKIDDRDTVDWDTVTDNSLGEDTYFVFYPRFDNEIKSHTVTIEWENGNTQVFTIELAETATLEITPAGSIKINDKIKDEDLIITSNDNNINLSGTLSWYRDVENDDNSGNFVWATITAPEIYTEEELSANASVSIMAFDKNDEIITESTINTDGVIFGGNNNFDVKVLATANVRIVEIDVKWENGNVQAFVIELDESLVIEEKPSVYVQSVALNKEKTDIVINNSERLIATILPETASTKNVKWVSSNPEVAKVDSNGNVTALSYGTAIITVTTKDGKFIDSCIVNSIYPELRVDKINLGESVIEMPGLFSREVTLTLAPTGGSETYTYYFEIYNASTGVKVGDTNSDNLDPNKNGFTITIRQKNLSYRVEYKVIDSVGTEKTGQYIIEAYEE